MVDFKQQHVGKITRVVKMNRYELEPETAEQGFLQILHNKRLLLQCPTEWSLLTI